MATEPTWVAASFGVAFASAKSMLCVFNGTSSAKILHVKEMLYLNNQTAGVTGVLTTNVIRRITAAASGTTVTPVKHDTNSSALDANTISQFGATVTPTDVFRHFTWSNDEPAVSAATMDEWECLIPNGRVWDASLGDSTIEPVFCRATQGVDIEQSSASAVGIVDIEIRFTNN